MATETRFHTNDRVLVRFGPDKGKVGIVTSVSESEWTGESIVWVWFEGAEADEMELPETLEKLPNMTGWVSGSCGRDTSIAITDMDVSTACAVCGSHQKRVTAVRVGNKNYCSRTCQFSPNA